MTVETQARLVRLLEWIIKIDASNKLKNKLPKPLTEMTKDEVAIFNLAARMTGQIIFLAQEAQAILSQLDPDRLNEMLEEQPSSDQS